jgi:4-hydroxy-4-methyl-2-oxoglutarate aldolase
MSDSILSQLDVLYPAVVADVLDAMGFPNQVLPHDIRPLTPQKKICGRVFTARAEAVHEVPAEPYKLEIEAVESMSSGDVFLVSTGQDRTCGFWGELLTTACLYKGVRGVVMDGCTRDLWKINELDFPVFGCGYHPADSKGRVDISEIQIEIRLGQVSIHPGDFLIGDEDGCVIIPAAQSTEAVRLAMEKVSGENIARADLAAGVPMGTVFRKYGIL